MLISVPNHSRDSFIIFRLDTLHLGDVCVGIIGKYYCTSLIWTYLYDADSFFQFLVLIRFLVLISVPNHSRDSFIIFRLDTLCLGVCWDHGEVVLYSLIGHISMMQMVSFNFWFWFGFWSTFQSRIIPEIYLFFQIGHFVVCWDHKSLVIHWLDIWFWFWFGFWISGFDSVTGSHVLRRRVCWDHWEVVLYFTDLDISLWCRWFLSISGFDSVTGSHFSPESFQRFIYFFRLDTLCLGDVYVGIIGKNFCTLLNWTYLYDADSFFQFRVLIRFLVLISVPNH